MKFSTGEAVKDPEGWGEVGRLPEKSFRGNC